MILLSVHFFAFSSVRVSHNATEALRRCCTCAKPSDVRSPLGLRTWAKPPLRCSGSPKGFPNIGNGIAEDGNFSTNVQSKNES